MGKGFTKRLSKFALPQEDAMHDQHIAKTLTGFILALALTACGGEGGGGGGGAPIGVPVVSQQQAYVKASNTGANDLFGRAVALSADGNTLAVGAIWEDSAATGVGGNQNDNTAVNAGAVHVFQ
jgi:hypothetical protein